MTSFTQLHPFEIRIYSMVRLEKLTSERSKAFHRIASLYVELSRMQADSPEYQKKVQEIALLKLGITKLQRSIVISRMKKAEHFFM